MSEASRTPGPWRSRRAEGNRYILGPRGEEIAAIYHNDAQSGANARFIITAANSHDELIAALEGLRRLYGTDPLAYPHTLRLKLIAADAALARAAEGGER